MRPRIAACSFLLALAVPSVAHADAGLVGEWHLDDSTLSAGVYSTPDTSGDGLTGTMTTAPVVQDGRFGKAMRFSAGHVVRVAADGPTAGGLTSQAFTITLWFQRTGAPGQVQYLVSKGTPSCNDSSFGIYTGYNDPMAGNNLGLQGYAWDGTNAAFSGKATDAVYDGRWHALAYTFANGLSRLSIDGADFGTRGTTPTSSGPLMPIGSVVYDKQPLLIGDFPSRSGCQMDAWSGALDEVRFYNRALSAVEIGRLADSTASTPPTADPPPTPTPAPTPAPAAAPAAVPAPATPAPAPKLLPITALTVLTWGRVNEPRGRTLLQQLSIEGAAAGDRVVLTCTGKGCPKRLKHKTVTVTATSIKHGKASLTSSIKGALLDPGATFTVTVSRAGFISRVSGYTMVKRRDPRRTVQCLGPGESKPRAC